MATMSFVIEGEVNVQVTVTEVNGDLVFDLLVLDDTGSIGDLNALFFDVLDDSLVSGLSVTGDMITDDNFDANSVTKVDSYTNMNGEVVQEYGKFDGGVQFGTQGIGEDDIRQTSFTLSHDSLDLSLETIALQDFGVRLTSVGTEDGTRDDSLKLGATAPEAPASAVIEAVDDSILVFSDNADGFEFIDGGAESVLANDTTDGTAYDGGIYQDGVEITEAITVAGSNGGTLTIYPDGTVDFNAGGDFDTLGAFEETITSFTYEIENGVTGTVDVTVIGLADPGDIGGGGIGIG
ncbi:hypothetical protein [Celeribacter neptunius]|uniref:Uncharacterized protein n=1 Tax=Celeribacter neptunius TaxID=588602 RepID=A0A1I3JMC1_9RHOB|nr:hypothetical protein [Celeribacter neptunius]SFI61409.1 hypothetical protein SAMN04487991_0400 [Celeribacter neptunius]